MTIIDAPSARTLVAGDLAAVFLPAHGMLGASLTHRGVELLRRVGDLDDAAAAGSTAGIPLLHPWANRLDTDRYRAAGRKVVLPRSSPLLHRDTNGLLIHGVPWSRLAWTVIEAKPDRLCAAHDWNRADLLAVFPFGHRLELEARLDHEGLTLETTLIANAGDRVPVSFGFHPYVGIPGLPRVAWRLQLPAMRKQVVDARGIPTGTEEPFAAQDELLGEREFDDGFAVADECAELSISGAGRRITVELVAGYRYAQVYAPRNGDFVALEPMTAPTNALSSGRGLHVVAPGGRFRAAFRIVVESVP
ncbi:MAG TPA: aldose 1-epimerase [Casimicrobiaceae bacterium]